MSFTASFYTVNVSPNTLDKGEPDEDAIVCPCTPFNSVSGLNGNILVDYKAALELKNYCKIEQTGGRTLYCYVRGFVKEIGGRMTLNLEIDPLMTNKTQIESCTGVLDTTSKLKDWETYMLGDRMLFAYGINKGKTQTYEDLDLASGRVYLGVYG